MSILYSLIKSGKIQVNQYSPILHRFWRGVDKLGPIHPVHGRCWVWVKCVSKGYGRFHVLGEKYAHRVSYKLLVGEIPEGLWVLHKCDNSLCVNPSHLFLGTHQDNVDDKVSKERQAKVNGESNGMSKLTESVVREIRSRYKPRHRIDGQAALAREFGISQMTVSLVVRYETWRHLV